MSQNLQNFVKFQKFQLENLVDFEKCCKTHILLQKSEPIQPKTSNILPKFCQPTLSDVQDGLGGHREPRGQKRRWARLSLLASVAQASRPQPPFRGTDHSSSKQKAAAQTSNENATGMCYLRVDQHHTQPWTVTLAKTTRGLNAEWGRN